MIFVVVALTGIVLAVVLTNPLGDLASLGLYRAWRNSCQPPGRRPLRR